MATTRQPAVALRDGRLVTISPVGAADAADLARLLDAVGEPRNEAFARAAQQSPGAPPHGALVARDERSLIAGAAGWVALDERVAECVGAVEPGCTEQGLGTLLLRRCAADAEAAGLGVLRVRLHPGAHATAAMLRDSGMPTSWDLDHPVAVVELAIGAARSGWATP